VGRSQIVGNTGNTAEVSPNGSLNVQSSAQKAVDVIPSDATVLAVTKGLYMGATGDVAVTMVDGSQVIFKNLSGGIVHPLSVTKVKATGTTATNIIAVY
jgi:co-chaperonin GroES (HSP10)